MVLNYYTIMIYLFIVWRVILWALTPPALKVHQDGVVEVSSTSGGSVSNAHLLLTTLHMTGAVSLKKLSVNHIDNNKKRFII